MKPPAGYIKGSISEHREEETKEEPRNQESRNQTGTV